MEHQWVISTVAGAIGGFFDGLFAQKGLVWISSRRERPGRAVLELGTIEYVLAGAVAGFLSYALNSGTASLDATAQLGPSAFSLLTGLAGSDFLRRMRNNRQLSETARSMNRGVEQVFEAIEELSKPEGREGG